MMLQTAPGLQTIFFGDTGKPFFSVTFRAISSTRSAMPFEEVYWVKPSRAAWAAASRICSGVRKSGCPASR